MLQHFAAVRANDTDRRYGSNALIDVKIRRAAQVDATVGQVNGALGITGKLREELGPSRDYLV